MFIGIVCLVVCLLSSHLVCAINASMTSCELILRSVDRWLSIEKSLFFLLSTFLEEDFAKDVFLLLVRIIVLHVVVVWLIKYTVRVVVAVRVLVPDTTCQRHPRVCAQATQAATSRLQVGLVVLTRDQQDALVESADHWDLRWLLRLLLLRLPLALSRSLLWLTRLILMCGWLLWSVSSFCPHQALSLGLCHRLLKLSRVLMFSYILQAARLLGVLHHLRLLLFDACAQR